MSPQRFETADVQRLLAQGLAIPEISRRLGVTYQAVRYRIRSENLRYQPDSGRNRLVMPDLRDLIEQGWKTGDIARKYKVGYKLVWWWIRKLKIPYNIERHGAQNPAWKGGRRKQGPYIYVWCPRHPYATRHGCVFEHRLVMELKIGRYLLPGEVVHHKRGYRNNPDNLELFETNAAHLATTLKGKIPKWTPEGRRRILEAVRRPRGRRKKPIRDK